MPARVIISLQNAQPFRIHAIYNELEDRFIVQDLIRSTTKEILGRIDDFVFALSLTAHDAGLASAESTRPHLQFDDSGFIWMPETGD